MLKFVALLWFGMTLLGCVAYETNAEATSTAAYQQTSNALLVENEARITVSPPTATPQPATPTPADIQPPALLPLYRSDFPFDFVVERYTYTVTTDEGQQIQTVKIEHNNLQPATRYTINGIEDYVMQVTLVDEVVDTVGANGVCETEAAAEFNARPLLNYHWLYIYNTLEFFQPADPFAGRSNNLPTERYTFAQRALVDADDQIDGIVGTVETYHFNNEAYITLHATIDALATGNPVTGQTGESHINYRYDLSILDEGFGIERPVNCTSSMDSGVQN